MGFVNRFPNIETFVRDLRHGVRGVGRAPGFSLALILTLALGIGANTAIFSAVYNVLLRPLPYPAGERLLWLGESNGQATGISVTWINFQHWRNENRVFEDMAAFARSDFTLTGHGEAQLTHAGMVTASFLGLTGAHAAAGRMFTPSDDRAGAAPVAVLTWEFWNKAYGADPAVLGATLALNGKPYQVIGVLHPEHRYFLRTIDFYLPLGPSASRTLNRGAHGNIRALGLLKPGFTLSSARANLDEILQRLALDDHGSETGHRAYGEYLAVAITGDVRQTLFLLMGAVGLLLLIACANVAGLLLVRGIGRTREIAIRTAIGAGRSRLIRQLLTENFVMVACGGVLGILLAQFCLVAMLKLAPANLPRLSEIGLDTHVLMFAAAITIVTGLLAGMAPVLVSSRVDVSSALKEGAPGSGSGPRSQRFRSALVVAEIAVTVVLTFGAGLLIRSLAVAQNAYPGFDSRNVLALELQLPSFAYKNDEAARQFYARLVGQLSHEPGVLDVGMVTCPPGAGDCGDWWYSVAGKPVPARTDVPLTLFTTADSGYFRTMRIPLLAGRAFRETDAAGAPPVVIVNENIAHKWWRRPQDAIGMQIKFGGPYQEGKLMEIAGVVADVSQMGLDAGKEPQMYLPYAQAGGGAMVVVLRTAADANLLIPSVRRRVAALDRNVPVQSLAPVDERLGATLQRRRFSTLLLGFFAALALLLAAIGIYGVLNYWVSVRNKEIAVRIALGAQRRSILQWAGWQAARLVTTGLILGLAGSWMASYWLTSAVYGVSARSPQLLGGTVLVVLAVATVASGLPVWRASRVDVRQNLHDA